MKLILAAVLAFGLSGLVPGRAAAEEPRTALVMGAWAYGGGQFQPLPGIQRDVAQMAEKLAALGFDVARVENPNLAEAERAIDEFGAKLKVRKGVGLFYFSGHGAELQGSNYLIPVGITSLSDKSDLKIKAINAQMVLNRMSNAQARINLVFLDCCRNEMTKAVTDTGLAPMSARGVFVGFATASGATAAAGMDGSPYTTALLRYMEKPGLEIKAMHTLVTRDVVLATKAAGDEQSPFENASLTGSFYFRGGEGDATGPSEEEIQRRVDAIVNERMRNAGGGLTAEQVREIMQTEISKMRAVNTPSNVQEPRTSFPPYREEPVMPAASPWLFSDSSTRYLSDNELSSLAKEDLWRARNEIYARKGYVFTTPRGKAFARSLGNYYRGAAPSMEAVERSFNKYEKANVDRIKAYER